MITRLNTRVTTSTESKHTRPPTTVADVHSSQSPALHCSSHYSLHQVSSMLSTRHYIHLAPLLSISTVHYSHSLTIYTILKEHRLPANLLFIINNNNSSSSSSTM